MSYDSLVRILILGGGGREHALAWAISRSKYVNKVFVAPGNAGTVWDENSRVGFAPGAPCERINLDPLNFPDVARFVRENSIYLTLVGDAEPLDAGIADYFKLDGLRIFGPSSGAAKIESSKSFAKKLMKRRGIPTPQSNTFVSSFEAEYYINQYDKDKCWVVKADGLASGKGTIICRDRFEAKSAIKELLEAKRFGNASTRIVVEEFFSGIEVSYFAFVNERDIKPFAVAHDYKRIYDGDTGPNTGGMGSIAPINLTSEQHKFIREKILEPLVHELYYEEDTPYRGVIFVGLSLTNDEIKVLEFNCRFGDPETQSIVPLLRCDFLEIIDKCVDGNLQNVNLDWSEQFSATVVTSTGGYPQQYNMGLPLALSIKPYSEDYIVFHAGTEMVDGRLVTSAGRIFNVTSVGKNINEAVEKSYQIVGQITFDGKYYRKDIGSFRANSLPD